MIVDNAGIRCRSLTECPSCKQSSQVVHEQLTDRIFGAPGTWSFRRCVDPRCGLMWVDPMPFPDETIKLYDAYYTHPPDEGVEEPSSVNTGPKAAVKSILARLLPHRRHVYLSRLGYLEDLAPGRVLEVGCGSGAFLRQVTRAGWSAFGLDFDPQAIAAICALPGVEARVGDLLSMQFEAALFDAVVMNNVIEHLSDPKAVFSECSRILKRGGQLVMVTPSSASLGYRTFGEDWRGLEVPRHLYVFSPTALKKFATDAGFEKAVTFSTAGGFTGTQMLLFSDQLKASRKGSSATMTSRAAARAIRREHFSILFGHDVGEWAVLVATN